MFRTEDYLDLTQFAFPQLFDGCNHVWEALPKITEFAKANLQPVREAKLVGTPFIADNVMIGAGTVVEHGAVIKGPTIIGANCEVRAGAYIRGGVIVGDDCVLGNSCEFKNCVLFNGCQVPHFNYVGDSILGHKAHLGAGVILSNLKSVNGTVSVGRDGNKVDTGLRKFGAIIGDTADIGCNCVLNPGSIIGRGAVLYPGVIWRGVCHPNRVIKLRQNQESYNRH
jgi:NDP-sugar pyrophosphorylase family protein